MIDPMIDPMAHIYERLSNVHIDKAYVRRNVLPDWWEDEAAYKPSGLAHAKLAIGKHLGVSIVKLMGQEPLQLDMGGAKFKRRSNLTVDQVAPATHIGRQVAWMIAHATKTPFVNLPSAHNLRRDILGAGSLASSRAAGTKKWLGLKELVGFAWDHGIPIVRIQELPKEAKRPDGLVVMVEGRPVIVLFSQRSEAAWLLFDIAHELGHIALGHLEGKECLVDGELGEQLKTTDQEEQEANDFALTVLTGMSEHLDFYPPTSAISGLPSVKARGLAKRARDYGNAHRIDPGHVLLSFAWKHRDFFSYAMAALKELPASMTSIDSINARLMKGVDFSKISPDSLVILQRLMGI